MKTPFCIVFLVLYAFTLSFVKIDFWIFAPVVVLLFFVTDLKAILKKVLLLNVFVIMVSLTLIFQGLNTLALELFLRSNAILLFTFLLFEKRDSFDIALGFSQLGFSNKSSSMLYFCIKFIHILQDELINFKRALRVRGFVPKTDLLTCKVSANFVGALFVKAFERADRLKKSMITRGFNGTLYTLHTGREIGVKELFFTGLMAIFIIWMWFR